MTLQWLEAKKLIGARLREPSLSDVAGKLDIPYFLGSDLDDIMLVCAQELLREIPPQMQHAIGAAAQTTITTGLFSPIIPTSVIDIMSVQIDGFPAKRADSLAMYYFKRRSRDTEAIYSFTANNLSEGILISAGGLTIRATAIIEPDLAVFQSDAPTFPPGYSDLLVERVLERLSLMTM